MKFRIIVHHQPRFLDELSIRAFHTMLAAINLGEIERAKFLLVLLDEVLKLREIPSCDSELWPFKIELARILACQDDSPDQSDCSPKLPSASLSLLPKIFNLLPVSLVEVLDGIDGGANQAEPGS